MALAWHRRFARPMEPVPWQRTTAARPGIEAPRRPTISRLPQRRVCRHSSSSIRPFRLFGLVARQQSEPQEVVRTKREEIGELTDWRKRIAAPELERHESVE